jgi:alpha-beta hydrolase superfamily lysophospholipase
VPRGYTLQAFDTRGHGRSGGARGHVDRFERYTDDIDHEVKSIRQHWPNTKLFVLGHSFGTLMVLSHGLHHSEDLTGMITTGTALQDALVVPGWKRALAGPLSILAPAWKMNNGILTKYLSHDPAVLEAYERDPLVHSWGTPRLAAEAEAVRTALAQHAGDWRVPLLMLHGGDDHICLPAGAKAFQARTPPGLVEYREYAGLYHEIHNEFGKETVFRDIEAWLQAR